MTYLRGPLPRFQHCSRGPSSFDGSVVGGAVCHAVDTAVRHAVRHTTGILFRSVVGCVVGTVFRPVVGKQTEGRLLSASITGLTHGGLLRGRLVSGLAHRHRSDVLHVYDARSTLKKGSFVISVRKGGLHVTYLGRRRRLHE